MIVTKDMWFSFTPEKRVEKLAEVLTELKEIDTPKSKLKTKFDQGRLASIKKTLEEFIINCISWESDRQLNRHY